MGGGAWVRSSFWGVVAANGVGGPANRCAEGARGIARRDATAPFGFVCTPEDIAAAVAYLVSEDGRYLTNQRIAVNGGGF